MKLGEVLSLLKAGYTKAEIAEMLKPEEVGDQPGEGVASPATSEPQKEAPAQNEAPAQSFATSEQFDALSKKFDDLTKTIQNFNITFSQQPAGADRSESAEDIISNAFLGGATK